MFDGTKLRPFVYSTKNFSALRYFFEAFSLQYQGKEALCTIISPHYRPFVLSCRTFVQFAPC